MDSNGVIAIAAVVADIAAMGGVYVAYRALRSQEVAFGRSSDALRLSLSADLIARLEERFDSDVLRGSRHSAARALIDRKDLVNAEDVFDFFEMVGLLNRLGALNDEMVHCTFFHWINLYWAAGREYITTVREDKASTMWTDFETVYQKVRDLEKRMDPHSRDLDLSSVALARYLTNELES
jgi:hypothetical protein